MSTPKRNHAKPPRFDTRAFIRANWATTTALVLWLSNYGVKVEAAAAYKWGHRNAIPAQFWPLVMVFLEIEKGGPVSLVQFMKQ